MADPYWSQFAHVWSFTKERPIVRGVLEARKQDGPRDDPYPVLMIRTASGYKIQVNITQKHLLAEMIRHRPDIGDEIEIVYDGEAPKAPPGMNPAKEFTVAVIHKTGSQSQEPGTGVRGSASENGAPGTGS